MQIFATDTFVLPLPPRHRFPMAKYARLRARVEAERAALRADLRALWHRAAERVLDAFPVPGLGAAKLRRRWVASRWARRSRALAAVGLDGGDGP